MNEFSEFTEVFVQENLELLNYLTADILDLEENFDAHQKYERSAEIINSLFRTLHTIKGNSRALGYEKMSLFLCAVEDVASSLREGSRTLTRDLVDHFLSAVDLLKEATQVIQDTGADDSVDYSHLKEIFIRINEEGKQEAEESAAKKTAAPVSPKEDQQAQPRPAKNEGSCGKDAPAPSREGRPKILIVEDDFVSRELLQEMLAPVGDCHIAVNGKEAIQAFERALENNKPYDLVCMDIMMDEMDGIEAVQHIRKIEQTRELQYSREVPIIMVTALGDPETVMKAFYQSGATAYLVKPIDGDKLLDEVASLGLMEQQATKVNKGKEGKEGKKSRESRESTESKESTV